MRLLLVEVLEVAVGVLVVTERMGLMQLVALVEALTWQAHLKVTPLEAVEQKVAMAVASLTLPNMEAGAELRLAI
jgi:hypothetical protein|tara:strand:+ start:2006 stop:2230 length:225 start_codon:yes stop_codon:yes gene_type:complete